MLPRDKGLPELAEYRRPVDEAEDFLGYWLIAAPIAVGALLAIVFVAF